MHQLCGKAASVWFIHKLIIHLPQIKQTALYPSFCVHYCLVPSPHVPSGTNLSKSFRQEERSRLTSHSQNVKTSLPLRSVHWSEQYPNAWQSPSDEILTSTAPTEQRFEDLGKYQSLYWGSHYSNITERWRYKPRATLRITTNPGRELSLRRRMTTEHKRSPETRATALTTREYVVGRFSV